MSLNPTTLRRDLALLLGRAVTLVVAVEMHLEALACRFVASNFFLTFGSPAAAVAHPVGSVRPIGSGTHTPQALSTSITRSGIW
jgi:hypothetical protein